MREIIKRNIQGLSILAVLLVISGLVHGYNMFNFPYYENDEGVYMSQAWSLLSEGKLAPYTYWYDHAPAGWMFIALWVKLTGGFFTFGTSVNSGRVLMLVLHLGTTVLLFYIAKKLSKGYLAAIVAVLIFSFSPLGIYFQRRVLLDNIMIFWVFVSLALLFKDKLKLSQIVLSASAFGFAVLTKENAIFFMPAFIYLLFSRSHKHNREFVVVKWLAISGSIISLYFLYALLKGELFPVGFWGDTKNRVSLITTLHNQLNRGNSLPIWDRHSDSYINLVEWIKKDPFIIVAGSLSTIASIIVSIKDKTLRAPSLLAILFWLFLIRGKLIIDFYVVPLIPLLALNIGILANILVQKLSHKVQFLRFLLISLAISSIYFYATSGSLNHFTKNETASQIAAMKWIKQNLEPDDYIIIDNHAYVDLHSGDKVFINADWFQKLSLDIEVRDDKYNNNYRNIDYISLSHEMVRQAGTIPEDFPLLIQALEYSYPIIEWKENSSSHINIPELISTNGDWMAIYRIKDEDTIVLESSWNFCKDNFIVSYGQVVDPESNYYKTTSEGQSYALLKAVWLDDRKTFDEVWTWSKDHLQYRMQDRLFSWLWIWDGSEYRLGDPASASDADEDIALALLFAYHRWENSAYLDSAKEIINSIWQQEVVEINGRYYLISGTSAETPEGYLINPSYLSPATYRIFTAIDNRHAWDRLTEDSYFLLNEIGKQNVTYLPPNWVLIDKNTGEIKSAQAHLSDIDADNYGFDAFRIMWRVALDAKWFGAQEAIDYLYKATPFFLQKWEEEKNFAAIYRTDGSRVSSFNSLSTSAGALSALTVSNKEVAGAIYSELFEQEFDYNEGFWGDKSNYYDQNWAWFATALHTNNLPLLFPAQAFVRN